MLLQVNIFILLFGAIQGFLLSLALLRERERHPSHVYLTLFLVVVGLQLTSKVITKVWLMENVIIFYRLSYTLPFLVGPSIYLFIRSRVTGVQLAKTDLLHTLPFLFYAILIIGWPTIDWVRALFQIISLCVYFVLSRRLIANDASNALKQFLNYVIIAEVIVSIVLAVMVTYYGRIPDLRLTFVLLTIIIYWITWKMMTDPNAFVAPKTVSVSLRVQPVARYSHSGLKEEEASRIENDLRALMSSQKIFIDSKLTIDKLAASLHTTRHHLSQVLNERVKRPYSDYISDLRLEEARQRLRDPRSARYTIAAIALDSGFSAVSTFNDAFKKKYGVTPSRFRDDIGKKMSA
ncbi:MAG TPA: helix-turn-helix transcriptional regulator [Cyclobacteriaceae bacterium]|nr:helix-turn-helix transcriptional regulator [Cyclobacteriaceae bacterium]